VVRHDDEFRLGEWACLACVAERPAHGFAVAACLAPTGELGRVVALSRPLTYRAIERLAAQSLVEVVGEERGRNGLTRTVYGATDRGRAALGDWLGTAVDDVTASWSELLVKVVVHQRLGVDVAPFVARQRAVLAPMLTEGARLSVDAVDVWHDESVRGALRFLDRVATPRPAHGAAPKSEPPASEPA
jgi:PadR family transcriptional regulator AphA